jgi:dimethylamine--corrinoid protein Co-methyltransferase
MEIIVTRMGDGSRIEMSAAEIQEELETGARDAAERARVPNLDDDEITYLLDLYRCQIQNCGIAGSGNKLREYV